MTERCRRTGLLGKPIEKTLIARKFAMQDFHGDVSLKRGVFGLKNSRRRATTDASNQSITAAEFDTGADTRG